MQPNGKSKRGKAKYPSARDFAKKQPKVRKTEKGNGKDYGWLDFLGLPKMKLPDFLGFNSEKQKAAEASKAAQQGKQVFAQSALKKWCVALQQAREALGIQGFCVAGGKTAGGKALRAKVKANLGK